MLTAENLADLLTVLGFQKKGAIYRKALGAAVLEVNFTKKEIGYPEAAGLVINERQTCNFEANENFVVLECVHRLLEKGATLSTLRDRHPAWRLLASPHAPLVASFLHRVYVVPNVRVMSEADLAEALEDELFALREHLGPEAYPKGAQDYLNDWAAPDKGWLRKFYKPGTDEAQFDLTPATEKAIAWLLTLTERPFVGTESRLLTLFALLEQISAGTEADPIKRVADLRKKRDELDAEIARVLAGDVPLLDDTAVKDRFQQFQQLARELLADFREVEHNFRLLDRKVREKIALWEGAKGALLDEIMGERDAIGDSDQGRSFRAFWDFLMSTRRQEELSERLDQVLALPAVRR
jgi:hypothetical protein